MSVPSTAEPLSGREVAALLFVTLTHERTGRGPSIRDTAAFLGRSLEVTHKLLRRLRAAGWVDWEDGLAGTLHPLVQRPSR